MNYEICYGFQILMLFTIKNDFTYEIFAFLSPILCLFYHQDLIEKVLIKCFFTWLFDKFILFYSVSGL